MKIDKLDRAQENWPADLERGPTRSNEDWGQSSKCPK